MNQGIPTPAADVTHAGGMRAKRVFPTDHQSHVDPFVVFERFFIEPSQGFETHPHRGFEIVSYMLDGGMVHEDSLGHESTARAGDAMRITTGSGLRHSELPADGAACNGLQLWVNLPRDQKDVDPSYQEAASEKLPVEESEHATVTTVVGEGSPLELLTDVSYRDVTITGDWDWTVPEEWVGVLFVVSGSGTVAGESITSAEYVVVDGHESVTLSTESELRFVVVAGRPHGEPIRQRGPFVE